MSTATIPAIQGRWGWYSIDHATFLRLKRFHRLLLRDRRATKRRSRWEAKLPENRRGSEPSAMGTDQRTYAWVLAEYRALRHPSPTPEAVPVPDLPEDWEARLGALEAFYAN